MWRLWRAFIEVVGHLESGKYREIIYIYIIFFSFLQILCVEGNNKILFTKLIISVMCSSYCFNEHVSIIAFVEPMIVKWCACESSMFQYPLDEKYNLEKCWERISSILRDEEMRPYCRAKCFAHLCITLWCCGNRIWLVTVNRNISEVSWKMIIDVDHFKVTVGKPLPPNVWDFEWVV